MKPCPRCGQQYEPGAGELRYYCRDCKRAAQRASYRKMLNRRENGVKGYQKATTRFLRVVGYLDYVDAETVALWQDWQIPYDGPTRDMIRGGDIPGGLIVRIGDGEPVAVAVLEAV